MKQSKIYLFSLIPIFIIFIFQTQIEGISFYDYFFIFELFFRESKFSAYKVGMFVYENEHNLTIPYYISYFNYLLFGGLNKTLCFLVLFFGITQLVIVLKYYNRIKERNLFLKSAYCLLISTAIFSPLGIEDNFTEGFSGTNWICSNMFVILSINQFLKHKVNKSNLNLMLSIFFLLMGNLTYSSSYVLWLMLCVFSFKDKKLRKKSFLFYLSFTIVVFLLHSYLSIRPERHPVPNYSINLDLFTYIISYLSMPIAIGFSLFEIIVMGSIICLLTIYFIIKYINSNQSYLDFFLILGGYVVFNAVISYIFRGEFDPELKYSYRYISLPLIFWVCLCSLMAYRVNNRIIISYILAMVFFFMSFFHFYDNKEIFLSRFEFQKNKKIISYAIKNNISDIQGVRKFLLPAFPEYLGDLYDLLEKNEHFPFNGYKFDCPDIGIQIDKKMLNKVSFNKIKYIRSVGPIYNMFSVNIPDLEVKCIMAIDNNNILRGVAFSKDNFFTKQGKYQGYMRKGSYNLKYLYYLNN